MLRWNRIWLSRVSAGVAIDGWGRWIVVPDDLDLLPLALTDGCGAPEPGALPARVTISVCYRECLTDYGPVLVPETRCAGDERCEAGTMVESYSLLVRPAVSMRCAAATSIRRSSLPPRPSARPPPTIRVCRWPT